jgi:hypothetical protein
MFGQGKEDKQTMTEREVPCGTEERSSVPAVRDADSASRHYLLVQSLEEVLVGAWEDSRGRVVVRREVRSFLSTGPTGRGR